MIAALGRRRAATAVALLASTVLGFSVLPRTLGVAEATAGRPFRVLTVNLLFGRADTQTIMNMVRELRPDVLNTQELTPGAVEGLDAAGLTEVMPHRVLQAEWSAGGSGIFSRFPLEPLDDALPPRWRATTCRWPGCRCPAGRRSSSSTCIRCRRSGRMPPPGRRRWSRCPARPAARCASWRATSTPRSTTCRCAGCWRAATRTPPTRWARG
ncbi:endonuclease/exonuclease/phosphatase family protein [Nonomuraea ferruginea]